MKIYASFINLARQSSEGQKRPLEQSFDLMEGERSPGQSSAATDTNNIKLKKKCMHLEARIEQLESEWMRK